MLKPHKEKKSCFNTDTKSYEAFFQGEHHNEAASCYQKKATE